jgi:hypothetical protein
MRIVELIIDEKDEQSGIDAISVVMSPAIESNFIHLSKHEVLLKEVDAEKRILMGAALIPNKQIYRKNDKTKDEYYIYFSEATIRKASELFLMNANQNNSTLEHSQKLKGMSVVESWIIEGQNDKSKNYGFDLPKGTWMISMKVNNDEIWNKVKLGEVKGFSIEGYFADRYEMNSKNIDMEEKAMVEKIKELIIKSELKSNKVDLSLIDDFTKEANKTIIEGALFKKEITESEKKLSAYFKLKSDLENQKKSLETDLKTLEIRISDINAGRNRTSKIYENLVNKSSDLGIDYPKSIDANMNEIENLVKYTKSVSPKNAKL